MNEDIILSTIPANGWRIRYRNPDGSMWSEPIVAWAIYADGAVKALTVDRGGYVEPTECESHCEIYHPDQEGQS